MGAGRAHTRGGDWFSNINSSQVIFLFRDMDTLGPREIISPGRSRLPSESQGREGPNQSLIRLFKAYIRVLFTFHAYSLTYSTI